MNKTIKINEEVKLKDEIKAGFADLFASLIIVSSSFSEISGKIKALPDFERGQLENTFKVLDDLYLQILKLIEEFNKVDKSSLSKKDKKTLWSLDDLANRFRVKLLAEEISYKIKTRPTVKKSPHVDLSLIEEIDTLLRNMIEILESTRNTIRSKVSWLQMQQMIGSSKTLNILTGVLIFLTVILTLEMILRRVFQL